MQKRHLLTPEQVSLWWTVLINHHPMRDFKIIVFSHFPHSERHSVHTATKLKSAFLTSELCWESFFIDQFWSLVAIPGTKLRKLPRSSTAATLHWQWKHPWHISAPSSTGPEWGAQYLSQVYGSLWPAAQKTGRKMERQWEAQRATKVVCGECCAPCCVTGHCSQQLDPSLLTQGCLWLKSFCS